MIFIGLDIGSTAVKAVAADEGGNILSRGRQTYPTETSGIYSTQIRRLAGCIGWRTAAGCCGLRNPGELRLGISAGAGAYSRSTVISPP